MSQNIPEEKAVPREVSVYAMPGQTPSGPQFTFERWKELVFGEGKLTAEEKTAGYHFCPEWDGDVFIRGFREGCACPPPDEGGGSMDTNTQTSSSLDTNQETSQVPQPPVHE